jgi:beta-mannanase
VDTKPIVNHFGFSANFSAEPQMNTRPLLVSDNFVLSWVKDAEWARGIDQEKALKQDLSYASANNRLPMLTVEPWPTKGNSSRTLLQDIAHGKYDREIGWFCGAVRDYNQPVLIRWGHEMENITGRYPWATRDGEAYKAAYRYFVSKCRSITANAAYMWSPAGNKNLNDYWPGSQYVDYIGLTVYDYEAWEIRYYGYNRSFKENFEERYARVKDYALPIVIAEFGATGEGRAAWISAALEEVQHYPLVKGILFFSALDPVSWGPMPAPDWRVQQPAAPGDS